MTTTRMCPALISLVFIMALLLAGCSSDDDGGGAPAADTSQTEATDTEPDAITQQVEASIIFTSPTFNEKRRIGKKHTCTEISANEPNISPPVGWENLPEGTVSLAMTMDSLEIEGAERVHWVTWNMPPILTGLEENVDHAEVLPDGTAQGTNGKGGIGYVGPCPPAIVSAFGEVTSGVYASQNNRAGSNVEGIEKYFFKLYALDTKLELPPSTTKADLLKAMDGHILAVGDLVGERQGDIIRKEH